MQKDFMGMAQQAQQPMEDDFFSPIPEQDLIDSGLPTGNDEGAIKERIMAMLAKFGVLEETSEANKVKLEKEAAKLAKAIVAKDIEAIEASPLNEIFEKIVDQENASLEPSEQEMAMMEQEEQPQQQAPTNFAGMMGGGGLGR